MAEENPTYSRTTLETMAEGAIAERFKLALIAIAGKMSAENVLTSDDDGFTQAVGQRAGVTLQKRATLANPFSLAPHRTFAEVAQPESPFIFRAHQAGEGKLPKCALYECDNGAWKLEAIKRVAAWINGEFDGRGIDIPVLA